MEFDFFKAIIQLAKDRGERLVLSSGVLAYFNAELDRRLALMLEQLEQPAESNQSVR
jgi:hypothetical protein